MIWATVMLKFARVIVQGGPKRQSFVAVTVVASAATAINTNSRPLRRCFGVIVKPPFTR